MVETKKRMITAFGEDPEGWNVGGSGDIGIDAFANAIQVYAFAQAEDVSVAQAADAFNVEPKLITEAVEWHGWMYLSGPDDDYTKLMIEHDGE